MPKRTDLQTILLIGSGPIVIGQACEFDYSGVQACKALREEGYRVVLVNSNPATIMTDPEFADRTYIEPMTAEVLEQIIAIERPQAILPTIGGQTGLNLAIEVAEAGVLEKYGVELIGAKLPAIKKAEDRNLFKAAMEKIGLDLPRSGYARTLAEAEAVRREIPLPLIIRPSRTLGGTGGGVATTPEEFQMIVEGGLAASPTHELLIEESIAGWKEFELEVMRDGKDNVVIVCSIENFDPMGVHTGDSITVAPAQTLTDKEYQLMRNAAIRIIREIGVDTGGSNIQFGVASRDRAARHHRDEPARVAELGAREQGDRLPDREDRRQARRRLHARRDPERHHPRDAGLLRADHRLRRHQDPALHLREVPGDARRARRADEVGRRGDGDRAHVQGVAAEGHALPRDRELRLRADRLPERSRAAPPPPRAERAALVGHCRRLPGRPLVWKRSRRRAASIRGSSATSRRSSPTRTSSAAAAPPASRPRRRWASPTSGSRPSPAPPRRTSAVARGAEQLHAVYKKVDTCGAEFAALTPYFYSSFDTEDESDVSKRKKIVILGGGPNRIGQGIEFDYCCVHAAFALKDDGFETIMVNCNPETVSTDYDTSDRLYFEPLTLEDVLAIVHREKPDGVIVQFGGQTPLKLAVPLAAAGVPIIGTSPDSIDRAEDRERFDEVLTKLNLLRPDNGIARSQVEAIAIANRIGYPVLVRPSYVLGGRAMEIIYEPHDLERYVRRAFAASPDRPLLIDRFLEDAIEVDVDAVSDGRDVVIGGIMEHIERAGVHSGDSACALPPTSIDAEVQAEIRRQTIAMARELGVVGLMNVQYAVQNRRVFILEVNPRASRTVPFVSKAIGVPLAKIAARVMAGKTLVELGFTREIVPAHVSVKEAVFPFLKFPGVDTVLGPEMKSTGEVMGIGPSFGVAFAKAEVAAGTVLPGGGTAFISVRDEDRPGAVVAARRLHALGFRIIATAGTAGELTRAGIAAETVNKVSDGSPHVVDALEAGRDRSRHQHAASLCPGAPRLVLDPADGARAQDPVLHDHRRSAGGGRGDRGDGGGPARREGGAGVSRGARRHVRLVASNELSLTERESVR